MRLTHVSKEGIGDQSEREEQEPKQRQKDGIVYACEERGEEVKQRDGNARKSHNQNR